MLKSILLLVVAASLTLGLAACTATTPAIPAAGTDRVADSMATGDVSSFKRVASFPVFLNTDVEAETVAEIVAATPDGLVLVYTDAETGSVGFVDIADPASPQPLGLVALGGEPTSVAVGGQTAFVAVNTSEDYVNPSGKLVLVDISSQQIEAEYDLGGQPDSVALSHDGQYIAIAVENERDEDLGDGSPPQDPPGYLVIFDVDSASLRNVDLTGIADLFPADPEPEYVSINDDNIVVATLQENNHIVLVDLADGSVVDDFSAGLVQLDRIDTIEDGVIRPDGSLADLPREPDGVTWIGDSLFATADEGDLNGGSRGFTIWDMDGNVVYASGNSADHVAIRLGHYPEDRSENKGSEAESVAFGAFSAGDYLFVGLERASLTLVYKLMEDGSAPEFMQVLTGGIGPEGLLAIPARDLFVTAAEVDDPGGIRSIVTIYALTEGPATYPTVTSADAPAGGPAGGPIAWGALSALAVDPANEDLVYSVHDSFYNESRIYTLDVSKEPAVIVDAIVLADGMDELSAVAPDLVNEDKTVNLDPEGLALRADGGFWIASEGRGSVDDADRPVESTNLLLRVGAAGEIEAVVELPEAVNARQRRFGFEGVASVGSGADEIVYVAFQREWVGDPDGLLRIGRYDQGAGEWTFYYYPREEPEAGGWIGLSELVALDDEIFAVIERDNQADVTAAVKAIYTFSISDLEAVADDGSDAPEFPIVTKTLAHDLLPDLAATGGAILEKVEGLTVTSDGTAIIVTDNDGVSDSSGETQLLRIEGAID